MLIDDITSVIFSTISTQFLDAIFEWQVKSMYAVMQWLCLFLLSIVLPVLAK